MGFTFLGFNWIDFIIIIVLAVYALEGFKRGFIHGWIDVGGFLFSLLAALRFYSFGARFLIAQFSLSRGIANALGFLIIAFIAEFIFYLIASLITHYIPKQWTSSKLNYRFGFIPAIVSGLLLIAFLLTALLSLPVRPNIKQDVVNSHIGGFITRQTLGLERSIGEVFGGALQETMTFLTVKPQGDETISLNFHTKEFSIDPASETQMLILVNQERKKQGLSTLAPDEQMRGVARQHCGDMFIRGYFSHYNPDGESPFDRMKEAGIDYQVAGENLAYAPTVEIAHDGLMKSPGHRANILSVDFGRVGIGVINAGIYGRMFCQEFRN